MVMSVCNVTFQHLDGCTYFVSILFDHGFNDLELKQLLALLFVTGDEERQPNVPRMKIFTKIKSPSTWPKFPSPITSSNFMSSHSRIG